MEKGWILVLGELAISIKSLIYCYLGATHTAASLPFDPGRQRHELRSRPLLHKFQSSFPIAKRFESEKYAIIYRRRSFRKSREMYWIISPYQGKGANVTNMPLKIAWGPDEHKMKKHPSLLFGTVLLALGAGSSVAQEPKTAEQYYAKAMAAMSARVSEDQYPARQKQIKSDLDRAIELDANNIRYLMARAKLVFADDPASTIKDLDRVIELNANDAEAYSFRGDIHFISGNNASALEDYTNAIRLDPRNAKHHVDRATVYNSLERRTEASDDYARAIELDPTEGYRARALHYFAKDDYANAIADFSKVIEIDPSDTSALEGRAEMYDFSGQNERAIADVTVLIQRRPNSALFQIRARLYKRIGKLALARKDEAAAIKLDRK